jgi:transposase
MEEAKQKPKKPHKRYSWFIKRQVALEYLQGAGTLMELSVKYGISHQNISEWSRSYSKDLEKRKSRILSDMTNEDQKDYDILKQQNATLKKELEFAQMKAKAMEAIIDIAKEELGIDLRKNSGAKQPVKSNKTTRRQK